MSKFLLLLIPFGFVALLLPSGVHADVPLIASYSLNQTAVDQTGNYGDIEIINAPYENGGVYLNGNYISGDPDSSAVITPSLTGMDIHSFTVSVDFKLGAWPATRRPILFGSSSWRWIGASVNKFGQLIFYYNGIDLPASTHIVSVDTWYTIVMIYDGTTGYLYLDGVEVSQKDFDIVYGTDREFVAHHGGNGVAFKGHLRNLNVYDGVAEALPTEQRSLGGIKALYR